LEESLSKNFELMQEATEMEQEQVAAPGLKQVVPLVGRDDNKHPSRFAFDRITREGLLKLVQHLFLGQAEKRRHVVVFAGIDPGNGCSRLCSETARALADNISGSVCLVDANLRAPSLSQLFSVTNHEGLADALLKEEPIRTFTKPVYHENLWLLSSGSPVKGPHLLNSKRLKVRFDELRKEFDHVLIDAPPLNQYADGRALGQVADGVVLVLEANSTRRESAVYAVEALRVAQIEVLGAVLNNRTLPIPESVYRKQ
jgi:Mrp family chromosome partitioning ATPase